jgi:hypothetical protein
MTPDGEKISCRPVLPLMPQSERLRKQEGLVLGLAASRVVYLLEQLRQSSSTLGGLSRELGQETGARSRSQPVPSLLEHVRETPEPREVKEVLIGALHRFVQERASTGGRLAVVNGSGNESKRGDQERNEPLFERAGAPVPRWLYT